jgi:hypothetical protein
VVVRSFPRSTTPGGETGYEDRKIETTERPAPTSRDETTAA